MERRQYTDEERSNALAALAANGGNIKQTAAQLNIPRKTLENWSRGKLHPDVADNGHKKRGPMADALEEVAWKLIDAIPPKIRKAPLNQTAVALGISIEKMRLLREQATAISGKEMTDEQRAARIEQLLNLAEGRRALALSQLNGEGGAGRSDSPAPVGAAAGAADDSVPTPG